MVWMYLASDLLVVSAQIAPIREARANGWMLLSPKVILSIIVGVMPPLGPTHQYHIHSGIGMDSSEKREACELNVDVAGEHSKILGWLFDGYGLCGRYSLNGTVPTDLDGCGGHTHEIKGIATYHYHIPDGFPWTIGCYHGCPEVTNNPHELSFTQSDESYGCK